MAEEENGKEMLGEHEELSEGALNESRSGDYVDDAGERPSGTPPESPPSKASGKRFLSILLLIVGVVGIGLYLLGQSWLVPDLPDRNPEPAPVAKMRVPVRAKAPEPAEAVREEIVAKETIVVAKRAPAEVVVKPQPKPVAGAAFMIRSKSYLYSGQLQRDISKIEKMGYEVKRTSQPESHEMTRLLVGVYGKRLAQKRLAKVNKIEKGAFLIAEKGKYAVYAGSFLSIDKARRFADLLYQQGIRVEEVPLRVDLPHTSLDFGQFATRKEAGRVVAELAKMGVLDLKIETNK